MTLQEIVAIIETEYGLPPGGLNAATRKANVSEARQVGMYLCVVVLGMTNRQAAAMFGRTDHTTAMHAVRSVEDKLRHGHPFVVGVISKVDPNAAIVRRPAPLEKPRMVDKSPAVVVSDGRLYGQLEYRHVAQAWRAISGERLSAERVRQIVSEAMRKIRPALEQNA